MPTTPPLPSPPLPWFELARFQRARLARAAVAIVALVPLLYGLLFVFANLEPTQNINQVRAAVVNEDELVEIEGPDGETQPVAVGRLLASELVSDDSDQNYDWVLTDAEDAREGLAEGSYKAVLTIPANLSKAATSTDDPATAVQGRLELETDDAVSYVDGTIAQAILGAARSSLNAQVTETYLDNIYLSFSDLKLALDEAAGGAGELSAGAGELSGGLDQLATGARQLEGGAGQLSSGLGQLRSQTSSLPKQARQLAEGAQLVADGTSQINDLVQPVVEALDGFLEVADDNIAVIQLALNTLAEACDGDVPDEIDCDLVEEASDQVDELVEQGETFSGRAEELADSTELLADGAQQVADGNKAIAKAAPQLVGAISQAAGGASQLASGTSQLRGGTDEAASGADQLAEGALQLSEGLTDGSDQVPDYTEDERDTLAETAATPVEASFERAHALSNDGEALAPYIMALALWIGSMAVYVLLRPLSNRAIASATGSIRTAFAGLLPGVAIASAQAVLLVLLLPLLPGFSPASFPLLLGIGLAAALTFTALNQALVAAMGQVGRLVALVVVCLQITVAEVLYPIETAPAFFGAIQDLLPMTYVIHGFRAAIAGGTEGVGGDFFALSVFTLLAVFTTIIAARARQTISMRRLHATGPSGERVPADAGAGAHRAP